MQRLEVPTAASMLDLGRRLGAELHSGDLVCLIGELGAGKTTLTQGIAHGLGIERPVTSPTFVTIKPYALGSGVDLYHVDLYRIDDKDYLDDQGILEELQRGAIVVVEWSDHARGLEEFSPLTISIAVVGERRVLEFRGSQIWEERLSWLA